MLANQALAADATQLLVPGAKADTSAATGDWIAVPRGSGHIMFISEVGTVTAGNVAGKIQHASDGSGTGVADLVTFTTVTTSNDPKTEVKTVLASSTLGYVRYIGTVTTGPVDASALMLLTPKYPD